VFGYSFARLFKKRIYLMMSVFYQPVDGVAADFIPLYFDNSFHLFYLKDYRNIEKQGEGTPWFQISTQDFVHFTDHGEMLKRGSVEEQDLYVFTGSAIHAEGKFHIFYTGHNPHLRRRGQPEQAVMHAVSDDLIHWTKLPEDTFFAPQDQYEPHDWRDPFVFWNPDACEYWMLLAARTRQGPSRRRGCTALCASKDLKNWQVRPPFWAPALFFTHECPDLFKMGDWWYLVFSEFSERCVTRYRMSRSINGPWLRPQEDTFDGRAFYAAKTASDGNKRFLFGWNPTRVDLKDDSAWQWGGNLVVHEIHQRADGTLSVGLPDSVSSLFARNMPVVFTPALGEAKIQKTQVNLSASGSFACASAGALPDCCKIETHICFTPETQGCGLFLRSSDDYEEGYYIRLEPQQNRLVFDRWPRNGDQPFIIGLDRPIDLSTGNSVNMTVLIDGSICEVYVNDEVAMSTRMYEHTHGQWGVFCEEGSVDFIRTSLSVPV
jgi:beta-fructofuranosidase